MKIRTTTARRQQVVGILAPQLHTLRHAGTGKLLKFVALPNSPAADRIRAMTAEALCDLFEENNLLLVRKPDPGAVVGEGDEIEIDLEAADLAAAPTPAPAQQQRVYKRMKPGDTPNDGIVDQGDVEAPAIITDQMPEPTAHAAIARSMAGAKPSDSAREAFERLGGRMRAEQFVTKIIGPLLQRMRCAVYITDDSDRQPDRQPTKMTILVELPRETTGA